MDIREELSRVDVFRGLNQDELQSVAAISRVIGFKEGEFIHYESARANELYILVQGEVELQVQLTTHNQRVTVGVVNRASQCFGWSGVIAPHYYTAAAVCRQDTTVISVDGPRLLDMLERDPVAGFKVMKGIAEIISSRLRNCRSALLKTL